MNSVKDGVTLAHILNPTGEAVELKWGTHLGEFYLVELLTDGVVEESCCPCILH